jgi:dTDP-glucose 4,6-dehydratase
MHIDDFIPTLANVVENFKPGKIYNIGGTEFRSVEDLSNIILNKLSLSDSLVTYLPEDFHNIKSKRPSVESAINDLNHKLSINLEEGVANTLKWMKKVYSSTIVHK